MRDCRVLPGVFEGPKQERQTGNVPKQASPASLPCRLPVHPAPFPSARRCARAACA